MIQRNVAFMCFFSRFTNISLANSNFWSMHMGTKDELSMDYNHPLYKECECPGDKSFFLWLPLGQLVIRGGLRYSHQNGTSEQVLR